MPPPHNTHSNPLVEAVLDAMPEAIALVDKEGRILVTNVAWRGMADGEGVFPGPGANCLDWVWPRGLERVGVEIGAVARGDQFGVARKFNVQLSEGAQWYQLAVSSLPEGALLTLTDVTTAQQAEAARSQGAKGVHDSLSLMQLIEQVSKVGTWSWDLVTGQVAWSAELERIYGFGEGNFPGSYNAFIERVMPEDRARMELLRDEAVAARRQFAVDFRVQLPGGEIRWVFASGAAIYDEAGTPLRIVGVNVDITERKRTEEALRASEARLRAVVEDQTEVIVRFAVDGTFLFANEIYCRFFGLSLSEAIGSKWQPVAHPDDLPMVQRQLARLAPEHPVEVIENRVFDAAGELHWMQFVNRGFFDEQGKLTEIQAVGRDVTARRRAEEALQASEARLRAVVEDQTEVIARVRTDGVFLFVNEAFCRQYGKPAAEIIGQPWQPTAHPEDLPLVMSNLAAISPANPVVMCENRVLAADGQVRWMQYANRGFFDAQGNLLEIQAVGRDVTGRREAEIRRDKLLAENIRLGHELIDLQERERSRLAQELHDELSQEVAAIRAYAGAIRHGVGGDPRKAMADAAAIEASAGRIYSTSHRIMESLHPRVLDSAGLVPALQQAIAAWSARYPAIRVHLRVVPGVAEPPPLVRIHLFRIAQECLTNTGLHAGASAVRVFYGRAGKAGWRLVVRDNGVGMDTAGEWPGLGLSVMRERAHSLDGDFTLSSSPGRGLRVAITIAGEATVGSGVYQARLDG